LLCFRIKGFAFGPYLSFFLSRSPLLPPSNPSKAAWVRMRSVREKLCLEYGKCNKPASLFASNSHWIGPKERKREGTKERKKEGGKKATNDQY